MPPFSPSVMTLLRHKDTSVEIAVPLIFHEIVSVYSLHPEADFRV